MPEEISNELLEALYHGQEETFGYGRYDFNTILHLAKTNPEIFNKIN